MNNIRIVYNRRKIVNQLRLTGLTPQQIAERLQVNLPVIRQDLRYLARYELPEIEDKYTRREIAERLSISKSEIRYKLSAFGILKPDAVFLGTFFYKEEAFAKVPLGPRRKRLPRPEPLRLDRIHQLCAIRASGTKIQEAAQMLGMTPAEANRLINRALQKGINVRQITADYYAELCLSAYHGKREFPPSLPLGDNLALITRITAFMKGIPIELIAAPGESCWSPEVGAKEIERNRGQLHPEEYTALKNLSLYKIAVWEMRRKNQKNGYHRKETPV